LLIPWSVPCAAGTALLPGGPGNLADQDALIVVLSLFSANFWVFCKEMNTADYYYSVFIPAYQKIGPCGTALVFIAGICLYLILKDFTYLWWVQRNFFRFTEKPQEKFAHPELVKKAKDKNPLLGIIFEVATHHGHHSEDIRSEVAYLFHYNFKGIIGELTLLRLFAVVSPLLGLMGTVLGMVDVFRVVSTQAAVDPALLAGGIWQALITTIMGLAVAVPALVFHHLLSLRMRGLQLTAVEFGYRADKFFNFSAQADDSSVKKNHVGSRSVEKPVSVTNMLQDIKRGSLEAGR